VVLQEHHRGTGCHALTKEEEVPVNRGLLILAAAMIFAGPFSWAEAPKADATPASSASPTAKAEASEKGMPVILVNADIDNNGISWKDYDCQRDGRLMEILAAWQNGKWVMWHDKEFLQPARIDDDFREMNNPVKQHKTSKDVPPCVHVEDQGVFAFHDILCRNKERTEVLPSDFRAMISKPVWQSTLHPAAKPPAVEALAGRMKKELKPLEEANRKACLKDPSWCGLCKGSPYDPDKLLPPEMTESVEFELAPGEPALFITLRRRFPCKETGYEGTPLSKSAENLYNSSNWHTIMRKGSLEPLWSAGWTYFYEKTWSNYRLMGAADINGDGIAEVVIAAFGYENEGYFLLEYKDKKLIKLYREDGT
jgi:hypothetical protein